MATSLRILCRSAVARFCSAGGADRSPAALGSRPATSPWDALNNRQTKGTGDPVVGWLGESTEARHSEFSYADR
jgi:hypothetical protein